MGSTFWLFKKEILKNSLNHTGTTRYCFLSTADEGSGEGGSVTYINDLGNTVTINDIYPSTGVVQVSAVEIVSTSQVEPTTC